MVRVGPEPGPMVAYNSRWAVGRTRRSPVRPRLWDRTWPWWAEGRWNHHVGKYQPIPPSRAL